MMYYRCDVCRKECGGGPGELHYPPEVFLKVDRLPGVDVQTRREVCSAACLARALCEMADKIGEQREEIRIVEAPGDRCGGSRVLPNDQVCPGCRACL